ncbi:MULTISPECIES: hypothetical protein [Klebsiella pneumoniae complex]|uniref:hypothetical protein n=1 Tax=Klebsiella pneumoniae complex TaxID=3390273 RepID=UPI000813B21C|nr:MULTISPECIES: hypothetical protein [Klebsiella]EJI7829078.1 hypothetical protein [Salmonella enterica]EKF5057931.1 hypothetical protein [Salmonella enterica]MDG0332259.1 hypothetical protein [Klebsiella pneumoniae]
MNSIDERITEKSIELVNLFMKKIESEDATANSHVRGVKAVIIYDEILTRGSVAISLDCITEPKKRNEK